VTSRGVSAWRDPERAGELCALRIFYGTLDARLIHLTPKREALPLISAPAGPSISRRCLHHSGVARWYQSHVRAGHCKRSGDLGSSIADNWKVDVGRGIVRAFDARTGQSALDLDPIPWADETITHRAGNAW